MSGHIVVPCLLAFLIGVVAGLRALTFGSDRPAALLEDAIAIGAALTVVLASR